MRVEHPAALADRIVHFFANDVAQFRQQLDEIDRQVGPAAAPQDDDVFARLCGAVGEIRAACSELEAAIGDDRELLSGVREQYRQQIAPWFERSWFMKRATDKPRGYPGDYATLSAIYDKQTRSLGIGGYLDLYFLNTTLGRAVADRMELARRFLITELNQRQGSVHVLNVASGPAREYVGGLDFRDGLDVRITCVDYDQEALDYVAQKVMKPWYDLPPIKLVRYNALRMSSAKANIKQFGKVDIIYSVGLCDYLPDKRLVAILDGLRQTLNQEGVLYIALKDCRRYDKTDYQWLVDWQFLQRTEEECRELLRRAGFAGDNVGMARDITGSIMNFDCRTTAAKRVRVDLPADTTPNPLSDPSMREQSS